MNSRKVGTSSPAILLIRSNSSTFTQYGLAATHELQLNIAMHEGSNRSCRYAGALVPKCARCHYVLDYGMKVRRLFRMDLADILGIAACLQQLHVDVIIIGFNMSKLESIGLIKIQ